MEIREKVSINSEGRNGKPYPPKTALWANGGLAVHQEEIMGYMQLGQDGLIGFGPAIHDGETAAYISLYFQAGDTLQEDKLVEMPLRHPSNGLNKNKGYFAHNDERITYEAFERLGPDVADETLSGYYARFVA